LGIDGPSTLAIKVRFHRRNAPVEDADAHIGAAVWQGGIGDFQVEHIGLYCSADLILSVSKDEVVAGFVCPTPWFDRLTTRSLGISAAAP
jgi:hypothetical protein